MVGANTFRNPGLTAKLATTLDNVSDGRAVLGIGGAWFEREHEAFGIEAWGRASASGSTGSTSRSGSCGGCSTASGSATTAAYYRLDDALCEPRPIQAHLPILIGGSGPKKTLRTMARRGDAWNTSGTLDEVRERRRDPARPLRRRRPRLRRDRADDQLPDRHPRRRGRRPRPPTRRSPPTGRDTLGARRRSSAARSSSPTASRPFADLGFATVIVRLPAPYDLRDDRPDGEVAELLGGVGVRG